MFTPRHPLEVLVPESLGPFLGDPYVPRIVLAYLSYPEIDGDEMEQEISQACVDMGVFMKRKVFHMAFDMDRRQRFVLHEAARRKGWKSMDVGRGTYGLVQCRHGTRLFSVPVQKYLRRQGFPDTNSDDPGCRCSVVQQMCKAAEWHPRFHGIVLHYDHLWCRLERAPSDSPACSVVLFHEHATVIGHVECDFYYHETFRRRIHRLKRLKALPPKVDP